MPIRTSDRLQVGGIYTRDTLRDLFDITDATLNNGIFRPKATDSVWLFVTEEKTPDRVQYTDHLDGDVLLMQGQTEGRTDDLIRNQATNGLELLVFHRTKKYEHDGAGFRYLGPFEYIRSFGSRPTSFVLQRHERRRSFKYGGIPSWRWPLQAVQQLGGHATKQQITEYVNARVPGFNDANIDPDLRLITVNEYGRSAWAPNTQPRRTDGWNVYDAIYRQGKGQDAIFALYDPARHGVWELAPDDLGVMRPRLLGDSPEVVQAQDEAGAAKAFDATNETDGRKKVLASIVQRRGQPKFRRDLVDAYDGRCAVTGCALVDILEGAHIKPYLGEHTNHVTNGLLLRADIHTLFDLRLLRINPETLQIEVAPRAQGAYGEFHGHTITLPTQTSRRPDKDALRMHFESCAVFFTG